jgi:hypothetical protein
MDAILSTYCPNTPLDVMFLSPDENNRPIFYNQAINIQTIILRPFI